MIDFLRSVLCVFRQIYLLWLRARSMWLSASCVCHHACLNVYWRKVHIQSKKNIPLHYRACVFEMLPVHSEVDLSIRISLSLTSLQIIKGLWNWNVYSSCYSKNLKNRYYDVMISTESWSLYSVSMRIMSVISSVIQHILLECHC